MRGSYSAIAILALLALGLSAFSVDEFNAISTSQTSEVVVGLNPGNKAPELNFASPDGKQIALSSLKGKVVLIDFWASWCGPCRMENPNIVRTYEKYREKKFTNGKGFTIYGVSLDVDKTRWQGAIVKDRLSWDAHVSDLKGWGSEASRIYRVNAIPSNFLIDGNGVIIARNLRGPALEMALEKIVVN